MPCQQTGCWKNFNYDGKISYQRAEPCDIGSERVRWKQCLPGYLELGKSVRRSVGPPQCPNRCKGHRRNKQNLSHYDVLQIQKTMAHYDPRGYLKR
jgi:hypothetical protein